MIVDAGLAANQRDECSCESRLQSKIKRFICIRTRIAGKVVLIFISLQNQGDTQKSKVISPALSI